MSLVGHEASQPVRRRSSPEDGSTRSVLVLPKKRDAGRCCTFDSTAQCFDFDVVEITLALTDEEEDAETRKKKKKSQKQQNKICGFILLQPDSASPDPSTKRAGLICGRCQRSKRDVHEVPPPSTRLNPGLETHLPPVSTRRLCNRRGGSGASSRRAAPASRPALGLLLPSGRGGGGQPETHDVILREQATGTRRESAQNPTSTSLN